MHGLLPSDAESSYYSPWKFAAGSWGRAWRRIGGSAATGRRHVAQTLPVPLHGRAHAAVLMALMTALFVAPAAPGDPGRAPARRSTGASVSVIVRGTAGQADAVADA